jgi:3D (Asp-Asp-Asp) domain-containing protein
MRRILARYAWVKVTVLLGAVVGFVLLYESHMLDSRNAAWQTMTNPDGSPMPGARLPFSATAYCKGTTTASGVGVRSGIAAADPSLLPVGSVLNIAVGDNRYNGVYTVMDTGPKVQGRLLDLYMWSCHEALKFGRKDVQVTVLRLGWDPRASAPSLIDRIFRGRASRRAPAREAPPPAGAAPVEDPSDTPADDPPDGNPAGAPGPAAPAAPEVTAPAL